MDIVNKLFFVYLKNSYLKQIKNHYDRIRVMAVGNREDSTKEEA